MGCFDVALLMLVIAGRGNLASLLSGIENILKENGKYFNVALKLHDVFSVEIIVVYQAQYKQGENSR